MKRALHSSAVRLIFILVANLLLISCNDDPVLPEPLVSNFEVSSDTLIIGDTARFTDLSINNPTSWKWFFGDGTTSTEQNPSHVYKSLGIYSVSLEVSNESEDNSMMKEDYVTVLEILTSNPQDSEFDLWVDENIMSVYDNSKYTGISIAFIDDNIVSKYHYGETKRNSDNLANDNTLYQIASVTKTFVGISTLRWLALNEISLDSSVISFLPEDVAPGLIYDGTEVTFRHLLNHTSGLDRNSFAFNSYACTQTANMDSSYVYDYLKNSTLNRRPGTTSTTNIYYSNLGFALLGLILERQNQKSLQEVLNDYILNELGMAETTILDRFMPELMNVAYPYGGYGHANICDEIFDNLNSAYRGAGGLFSNLTDMIKYARFLLSYDIGTDLGKAVIQSLETQYQAGEESMCLPWFNKQTASGDKIFFHNGGGSGMNTIFAVNETNKRAVIFFTNYWITDPDWYFMIDFIDQYLDGNYEGGRISPKMLKPKRRY